MSESPTDINHRRTDVAVIGAGTATETLVAELAGSDLSVTVFELERVGGECPFVACMPSKAMLHDAAVGRTWGDAVRRRSDVVENLDDRRHAVALVADGAELVRERARIVGLGEVEAGGIHYCAEHIVIATGSAPIMPPIDGLDELGDRCWTSTDALTASERPTRLTIIGGGVIGCELATIFSRFGTEVHLLDADPVPFPDLPPEVGAIVDDALRSSGAQVARGVEVTRVEIRGGGVRIHLDSGASLDTDRVLVAVGTRPRIDGLGLENVGVDDDAPLVVGDDGRVEAAAGSVWAMGDVAGRGQYTHVANHHARVVAASLTGCADRRFDDVTTSACVFTDPPIVSVGPRPADTGDGVEWFSGRISEVARAITDDLVDGYLTIAVDRTSRCVVAAHGVGDSFDTLSAALVTAIDAGITVDRLARSVIAFPTVGELLGVLYARASDSLATS